MSEKINFQSKGDTVSLADIMPTLKSARDVHSTVVSARDIIKDEQNLCKNQLRQESNMCGTSVVQRCARGAVMASRGMEPLLPMPHLIHDAIIKVQDDPADHLLSLAAEQLYEDDQKLELYRGWLPGMAHVFVNNLFEHDDVMMVFDRAIILAEKRLGELLDV